MNTRWRLPWEYARDTAVSVDTAAALLRNRRRDRFAMASAIVADSTRPTPALDAAESCRAVILLPQQGGKIQLHWLEHSLRRGAPTAERSGSARLAQPRAPHRGCVSWVPELTASGRSLRQCAHCVSLKTTFTVVSTSTGSPFNT